MNTQDYRAIRCFGVGDPKEIVNTIQIGLRSRVRAALSILDGRSLWTIQDALQLPSDAIASFLAPEDSKPVNPRPKLDTTLFRKLGGILGLSLADILKKPTVSEQDAEYFRSAMIAEGFKFGQPDGAPASPTTPPDTLSAYVYLRAIAEMDSLL